MPDRPDANFRRGALLGGGFLLWNIIIVTIAIVITANTQGENVGKFVGTVGSAIAFLPPAWFVWQWYQQRAAQDRLQVLRRHVGETAEATQATQANVRPEPPATHPADPSPQIGAREPHSGANT